MRARMIAIDFYVQVKYRTYPLMWHVSVSIAPIPPTVVVVVSNLRKVKVLPYLLPHICNKRDARRVNVDW